MKREGERDIKRQRYRERERDIKRQRYRERERKRQRERTCGSKPMSNMRSASSSTKYVTCTRGLSVRRTPRTSHKVSTSRSVRKTCTQWVT